MRFLIIDESPDSRAALGAMLRAHWPGAELTSWDPVRNGHARRAMSGARYTAILLDAHPAGEDGVNWVGELRSGPTPPPVLLLTDQGGEMNAVRAMKAGAADFLRKSDLDAARLASALREAMRPKDDPASDPVGDSGILQGTTDLRARPAPIAAADQLIPGYRILRKVGVGGSAHVFLAEREADALRLALKVLDPLLRDDEIFLKRFMREYQVVSTLDNAFVAQIYDQGFNARHPYIAMEYLPGGDLKARMGKPMGSRAALKLTAQLALALDAIHAHGIIHRDLKPQNILFRDDGRPAIVDFGLAKPIDVLSTLTRIGEVLATPRYMSPEQCAGGEVDLRTDLYSLGVVFYELLAGTPLFDAKAPADLIYHHTNSPVPRLPARLAGYQPIVDRLLAKSPEARYPSARDLYAAIAI